MAVAARVERASPEGTSRFERDGLSKCPTLPWRQEQDLNLHTPCDVILASNEVRCHSAHPTNTNNLAETIRFERMVPFKGTPRQQCGALNHSATSPQIFGGDGEI